MNPQNAPNIINYLERFKKELKNRAEACNGLYSWYRLQRPREQSLFDSPEKIIVPYRAEWNKFGYDTQQRYNDGGDIRIIVVTDKSYPTKYIIALLNSNLMNFYYQFIGRKKGKVYEYFVEPLLKIPIVKTIPNNEQLIIKLTDKAIFLRKQEFNLRGKRTDEMAKIKEEIRKTDSEIDELVYKIYGIT